MASYSDILNALKVHYPHSKMARKWYEDMPLSAWIPKAKNFYGRERRFTVNYGPGGGVSHSFSDAQAAEDNPNTYAEFIMAKVKSYGLLYLDGEAIETSEAATASYISTRKDHLDGVINRLKVQEGYELVGHSGAISGSALTTRASGCLGVISSISSNTITLVNSQHITRIEPGMRLTAANAETTGSELDGGNYVTVDTVDAAAGTFDVTDITDISGIAATDFLYPKGNRNNAITGLKSWLPTTTEIASYPALWSVTRTDHRTRLAGYYEDVSSYSPAEALQVGLTHMARLQMFPDVIWVSHQQFLNIELDLGARAVREPVKIGEWGYDSLVVTSASKKVRIMADNNIDDADGFALKRKTWCRATLKPMPHFLTYGGGQNIIKPTDDGIELRLGWRGNMECINPGDGNGRFLLPT